MFFLRTNRNFFSLIFSKLKFFIFRKKIKEIKFWTTKMTFNSSNHSSLINIELKITIETLPANEHLLYVALNVICIVSGIIGNLFIMGAIICSKELQTIASIIIFNLSLADIMICITSGPLSMIGRCYD